MDTPKILPTPPAGLAFEIDDLELLLDWAKTRGVQLQVEIDHYVENEEYEEVVACYARNSPLRRWTMWRTTGGIIVQPLIGRSLQFPSVTAALTSSIAAPA